MGGNPPTRDSGPTVFPDAGDAGVDAGDAGRDGGRPDTGDAGPAVDAGDAGHPRTGEVVVSEFATQPASFTAFGELVDRSPATYDVTRDEYPVAGGTCVVDRRVRTAGLEIPIASPSLDLVLGTLPNQTFSYLPVGMGLYEPSAPLTSGLFFNSTGAMLTIRPGLGLGTPTMATLSVEAPPAMNVVQPNPGAPVLLAAGVVFTWVASGPIVDDRRVVAEIYDDPRTTKLTCVIDDDTGSFSIPANVVDAYTMEMPTAPLTLELRYEYATTELVPLMGTDVMRVRFSAARGQRWVAQ